MQNNYVPESRFSQNTLMNIWESISANHKYISISKGARGIVSYH